ncbi:MAG: hypothetical protein NZ602_09835, partial [Thermoguttaceae bacterium]|nr:hypothetical protein [Thermoguttaceae bacterium]
MSGPYKWVGLLAGWMLALAPGSLWAITITSPVMPGDVFGVNNVGNTLFQFRATGTTSTVSGMTNLGGVTTDGLGNLWFAHGDGSASAPFLIEMIPFAGTTSTVKLSGATLNAPTGASGMRDLLFDSSGALYISFYRASDATLHLNKYLPDGAGGFLPGTYVGSFGSGFGDYGGGRLALSNNQLFATTGVWSQRLYSMRLFDGTSSNVAP